MRSRKCSPVFELLIIEKRGLRAVVQSRSRNSIEVFAPLRAQCHAGDRTAFNTNGPNFRIRRLPGALLDRLHISVTFLEGTAELSAQGQQAAPWRDSL